MFELRIADVVTHEHEHASRLNPVSNHIDVRLLNEVRMFILLPGVRIDDDIDVCLL